MTLQRIFHWLRYLCGWLFILTSAIWGTVHAVWLYRITLNTTNVLDLVGLSKQTMLHNYHQLLAYLDWPWVRELNMSNFTDSLSAIQHFVAVKRLLLINNVVLLITLPIVAWGLWRMFRQQRLWQLLLPMQWALPIPPVVAIMMGLNFNQFFVLFHDVFFQNSDWLFDPAVDPIINALPASFFLNCFVLFFAILEIWLLAGVFVSRWQARHI